MRTDPVGNVLVGDAPSLTESYFWAMIQRSSDAAFVIDEDGRIRFASPAVSIFGYSPAFLRGRNVREFVHPDDLDDGANVALVRSGLAASSSAAVQWRLLAADGTWRWVEEALTDLTDDPAVAGIVINLRDITLRRQAEDALRSSEARFRRLFDGGPIGTAVVDLEGRVVEANDALLALLGYGAEDLIGRHFSEITHPDDLAEDAALADRLFAGEIERYQLDKRYIRKDGTEIVGRLTVSLVPDDMGHPLYCIGVIEDVTEMVRGQKTLARNEERLRMALDASRVAIWENDFASHRITVSENFDEVLGIAAGASRSVYDGYLQFIHPDDAAEFLAFQNQVLTADDSHEFALDHRFVSPTRGLRWIHSRGRLIRDAEGKKVRIMGAVMDVTNDRTAERQRLESEQVFRHTVEATTDAFVGIRSDGVITDWNQSAQAIFGWTTEEACGRHFEMVIPPAARPGRRKALARVAKHPDRSRMAAGPVETTALTKDGRMIPVEVSVVGVERDGDCGFNAFVRDITARKNVEAELARQVFTDEPTGLPNRALLQDRLDGALSRFKPDNWLAVLFVDFDRLKVVNESLGHSAGDDALSAIADRLAAAARPGDTVARFAGDEFVIVAERLASVHAVTELARSILVACSESLRIDGHELRPGVSIGIALAASDSTADELLRDADLAMYQAKERGRNRFEFFDVAMREEAIHRLHLEYELRLAIDDDQLRVHYQPILSADGELVSAEALVRWEHPERGLLPPVDFIRLAEETGLIVDLGEWVLRAACIRAAAWRREVPELSMAVNISTRQLIEPRLPGVIAGILAEVGLPPSALCLELTESTLLEDEARAHDCVAELRGIGVQIALDDFGTGYSSLTYLRHLPVQFLKLDRSFVSGLADNPQDAAIVGSTIQLAHALGLKAVAEGVETSEQLEALRRLDCDLMQGFLWSCPLPHETFEEQFLGTVLSGSARQ